MKANRFLLVLAVAAALQGCSSVKNLFSGGDDDRVLPGNRENVLPPDQQTARDPVVTGDQTLDAPPAPPDVDQPITDGDCKLNDPNCLPPVDQESGTSDVQ
jgi:hypothetical protein